MFSIHKFSVNVPEREDGDYEIEEAAYEDLEAAAERLIDNLHSTNWGFPNFGFAGDISVLREEVTVFWITPAGKAAADLIKENIEMNWIEAYCLNDVYTEYLHIAIEYEPETTVNCENFDALYNACNRLSEEGYSKKDLTELIKIYGFKV